MATLKDRSIIGAISGAIALLIRDAYSLVVESIGLAKFHVWWLGASVFLKEKSDIKGLGGILVGTPADMTMGAIIGVGYVYLLKWTEDKNPILKGLGVGLATWLLLYGLFWHNLPFIQKELAPGDVASNISAIVGHSIFGIALGIISWSLLKWQGLAGNGTKRKAGNRDSQKDNDDGEQHGVTAPKAPSGP